jgi:hypothetical protein
VDEVFVEVDKVVAGPVEDAFELFFVFLDFYHFKAVVQELVLFNVV